MPALSLPVAHQSIDAALLPEIIRLYLAAKAATITPATAQNYDIHLAPWRAWWESCAAGYGYQLSPSILSEAERWLRTEYRNSYGKPAAYNTLAHCWKRLRQLFNWAYKSNCTGTANLADWCPDIQLIAPSVHFPTLDELSRILAAPEGETRLRDVALMAFLVSTGARRYEVSMATVEAVTWVTAITAIDVGGNHAGYCLLRKVKGDREGLSVGRPVAFDSIAGLLLKVYLRSVNRTQGSIFGLKLNRDTRIDAAHGSRVAQFLANVWKWHE